MRPTESKVLRPANTSISFFPNVVSPLSAQGFPCISSRPIDPNHTLFEWTTDRPDRSEDTAEIEQAREVTFNTPVTIIEQDTRNMNLMHKSLRSPGLLGIR